MAGAEPVLVKEPLGVLPVAVAVELKERVCDALAVPVCVELDVLVCVKLNEPVSVELSVPKGDMMRGK